MIRIKPFHVLNVDMILHKQRIWACLVSLLQFCVLHILFPFLARSHKFGRQGQTNWDDDDNEESVSGYSYSYGNDNYEENSDSDDDYEEDISEDSSEESEEEKINVKT